MFPEDTLQDAYETLVTLLITAMGPEQSCSMHIMPVGESMRDEAQALQSKQNAEAPEGVLRLEQIVKEVLMAATHEDIPL